MRRSYVLHLVRDVVEGRVAVDLALRRLEQLACLVRVGCDDLGRRDDPQAHPFHPPRVGVARMGKGELQVRSMNTANVAMRQAAFRANEHFPERPVTAHAAFLARRLASCAAAASRTQAPLSHASRRAFIRSLATGPSPRTTA